MQKFILILKIIAIFITLFIILNGTLLLVLRGFSLWFSLLMLLELVLFLVQIYLLKKIAYHYSYNIVYVLPLPIIIMITLFGS